MFNILLLSNIFATLFMTGLIWFVQAVHYPGFAKITSANFKSYHHFHVTRTAFVVIPPMLVELGTSIWLTLAFEKLQLLNAVGLSLVIGVWLSTFALQVRLHNKLQDQWLEYDIFKLVITNWIRTVLWSLKAILGFYILIRIV